MIPPWLATTGVKIGGVLAAVLALYGWGYWNGRDAVQTRWDAATAKQAVAVAKTMIDQASTTAKIVTKYIRVKGETEIVTRTVEKEVIRYVDAPIPKCGIDPEFERLYDAARRVVPTPANSTGRLDGEGGSGLSLAAVLQADAEFAGRYFALADRHDALVDWVHAHMTSPQ